MNSVLTKISAIKRNPNNPRILKDDKFVKLTQSIKDFPQMLDIRPIVVNDDMVVLGGNMRLKACKEAGLKEVPVIKVNDLTEEQQREFIIKDNVGFGEWDWDLLANEWDTDLLEDWGLELDFNPVDDDNAGLTDEDDVPEVTENPVSKVGDIWLLGEHRVMCGDSTNGGDVALLMNGEKADMVFTDPPYGISIVSDGGKVGGDSLAKTGDYAAVAGDDSIDVAVKAIDVIKTLGADVEIIWGGNYYADALENSSCWIVWDKRGEMAGNNFADCELAWTNQKTAVRKFTHLWSGMIKASEHGKKRVHPTQKPIALAEWCFDNYGKECNTVLDLFGGSGFTLMACETRNKKGMIMELSPEYVDVIIKRWQDYTGKKAIHAESGDEFIEVSND
jgi:DNA modification methylase